METNAFSGKKHEEKRGTEYRTPFRLSKSLAEFAALRRIK